MKDKDYDDLYEGGNVILTASDLDQLMEEYHQEEVSDGEPTKPSYIEQ